MSIGTKKERRKVATMEVMRIKHFIWNALNGIALVSKEKNGFNALRHKLWAHTTFVNKNILFDECKNYTSDLED